MQIKTCAVIGIVVLIGFAMVCVWYPPAIPPGTIVARQCDGNDAPHADVPLDENSARRLRKVLSGFGWIMPHEESRVIPSGRFDVGKVSVLWEGNELKRENFPIKGMDSYWTFPEGKAVGNDRSHIGIGGSAIELVIARLRSEHK